MRTINDHIKNKTFSNFYLLYGEENYLIRYYRDKLTEGILSDENPSGNINYHYYEGSGADPSLIADQCLCLPFFSDVQLIVVENSNLMKSSSNLADIFSDIPESTKIIFVETNIDKRNALYKFIKLNGVATEINHKNETELTSWIASYFSRSSCLVTKRAASLILFKVGFDMNTIATELEKLISYVGESKKIDVDDVEAICTTQLSNKIFLMMDNIISSNQTKALNLYRDLVILKENSSNILFLLTRHYNILLRIKDIDHESDADIAKKLAVPTFAVRKYKNQAAYYTKKELLNCILLCTNTEEAIKTGRITAQIATEILIISLSSAKQNT